MRKFKIKVNGTEYEVEVEELTNEAQSKPADTEKTQENTEKSGK